MKYETEKELAFALISELAGMAIIINELPVLNKRGIAMHLLDELFVERGTDPEKAEDVKRMFFELLQKSPKELTELLDNLKAQSSA